MGFKLQEHKTATVFLSEEENAVDSMFSEQDYTINVSFETFNFIKTKTPRNFKRERNKDYNCYQLKKDDNKILLESNYYVGIDWICEEKKRYVHVEPKLNCFVIESFEKVTELENENISQENINKIDTEAKKHAENNNPLKEKEVDVIGMLLQIMSHAEISEYTNNLLLIDWDAQEIPVTQKQDLLTPFLIAKFLNILQAITKKGLKKSYYKVQENLRNRVKGKILVGRQIKQNIFKNRFTNTVCEYQVFGEDSLENRFLKKVFTFCINYVENHKYYFKEKKDISWLINYIRPAFEHLGSEVNLQEIKHYKHNPFFKEYKEALTIGQQILKRFSYNITKTTEEKISTPPFWIDMPKMFELYVFAKLLKDNPHLKKKDLNYQFSTYGNSLDFLINSGEKKMVVDAKYKLHYNYSQIHEDIRQVSGYARLKKVRQELGVNDINEEIPCLIIYPKTIDNKNDEALLLDNLLNDEIKAYNKIYKIGITLPII
ncbi:hypothetical protein GCM10022217_41250 [Chryseobacterium ginsenosidimutans]|uniref:5-methylcytosine restriction system specificity protein McrC n=1 Tax=Chryseobacterium ginsenosidimutans TaxID=687846 RepID=UPI0031D1C0C7